MDNGKPVLQMKELVALNFSYNSISAMPALTSLSRLKTLNVSHNALESLKLGCLPSLCVLLATDNKVSSLSGVE